MEGDGYAIIVAESNPNMKQTSSSKIKLFALTASLALVFGFASPVLAADLGGGDITGYGADSPIDYGTVVELTGENADRVKIATQPEMQNMFGVVIDPAKLSVRMITEGIENQTYVAVSGTHSTLVSTQGGEIEKGDHLTMSSINGILMKAGTEEATVFGRAGTNFSADSPAVGSTAIQDTNGNVLETVLLGSIPVTVDIKANPNEISTKTKVPSILEQIGQAIAEREVSSFRIYLSMAIAAISLFIALMVIYSGVRNSIISIGRNPMSKKSIFRALLEIILTSLLILIIGLFAVYLLLRL